MVGMSANISRTKSQHLKDSCTVLWLSLPAESLQSRRQVENEDVVGAAPTGAAPTTSEWSTILLPTKDVSYIRGFTVVYCDYSWRTMHTCGADLIRNPTIWLAESLIRST